MAPKGLVFTTDHGFALIEAARRMQEVATTDERLAELQERIDAMRDAIEVFGTALWTPVSKYPGWDVQDYLAHIKDRYDLYIKACEALSEEVSGGLW